MKKVKRHCPHCGTSFEEGDFNELVAYVVFLKEQNGVLIREKALFPTDDEDFGEHTYFCETCNMAFKEFEKKEVEDDD